jgi:two-component system response regulator
MAGRSVLVLLVEDNPSDAELTLHALRRHNLVNGIDHVRDGEEALDYLYGRGQYDDRDIRSLPKVILLDLKLPKVDGMEVLRIVKSDPQLRSIPVVVLTSSKEEKDIVNSYDLGVNSYIQKPVDFQKFTEAIAQVGYYWVILNERP